MNNSINIDIKNILYYLDNIFKYSNNQILIKKNIDYNIAKEYIQTLYLCNCCKRHKNKFYNNYNFNLQFNQNQNHKCKCKCRHYARFLMRIFSINNAI